MLVVKSIKKTKKHWPSPKEQADSFCQILSLALFFAFQRRCLFLRSVVFGDKYEIFLVFFNSSLAFSANLCIILNIFFRWPIFLTYNFQTLRKLHKAIATKTKKDYYFQGNSLIKTLRD